MLQGLPQLTYLELAGMQLIGPDRISPALQPLQALTRLADLRLAFLDCTVNADVLSQAGHLTRLVVEGAALEPGALAGKTNLKHLHLSSCKVQYGNAALVTQMLSHLQVMQQLKHLHLADTLPDSWDNIPPAAAYSALTASSTLQHLDISGCRLSARVVWCHVFPAGRQLPQLQELNIARAGHRQLAPAGSCLVSCCPGLQVLDLRGLNDCAQVLSHLRGLSGLHTLRLARDAVSSATDLEALCQLTDLKELTVPAVLDGQLLQLSMLQQLTSHSVDRYRARQHRLDCKVGLTFAHHCMPCLIHGNLPSLLPICA
jgi:hypothetical protein